MINSTTIYYLVNRFRPQLFFMRLYLLHLFTYKILNILKYFGVKVAFRINKNVSKVFINNDPFDLMDRSEPRIKCHIFCAKMTISTY